MCHPLSTDELALIAGKTIFEKENVRQNITKMKCGH
jgi:hypothetical protein